LPEVVYKASPCQNTGPRLFKHRLAEPTETPGENQKMQKDAKSMWAFIFGIPTFHFSMAATIFSASETFSAMSHALVCLAHL
jgi:hypothetical protein